MVPSIDVLAQLGPILLLGTTILLGFGALAVTLARQPVLRQRLGEITVAVTLAWMVLACVPLDRVDWSMHTVFEHQTTPVHSEGAGGQQARGGPTGVLPNPATIPSYVRPSLESTVTVGGDLPRESKSKPATRATPASVSAPGLAAEAAHWARVVWRPSAWMLLYLLGSVLCGLWLILGHMFLLRVQVAAQPAPDWLGALYQNVVASRPSRLLISSRARRPFSFGILRPTIVLPADIVQPQCTRMLQHVLCHEQAHIERRDAWGHALFSLAFPILYVHPLYWWHRSAVQFARELIADDWAAAEQSKPDYADDLLHLLQSRNMSWVRSIGMLGIFQFRSSLARRINMLLERTDRLAVCASRTFVSLAAATGLLLLIAATSVLGMRVSAAAGESDGAGNSSEDHSVSVLSQAADRTELKEEYAVDRCVLVPAGGPSAGAGRRCAGPT